MEIKGPRTQVPVVSSPWVGLRGESSHTTPSRRSMFYCCSVIVIVYEGLPIGDTGCPLSAKT